MTASATTGGPVGVAVITHNARKHLPHCLPAYLNSPLRPRVLVVNSSSRDGTVELARSLGAQTLVIPRDEFNHGLTRELARKHLATEIICMATPDAYPVDEQVLGRLIQPIQDRQASVSYARQIPHPGAGFLECFLREFNYPPVGALRSLEDAADSNVGTFFCSDACAAYRNSALDEVGGFPAVLSNEDQFAVARLLRAGHRVAYVAEAVVRHSHRANLWGDFRRSFDAGYARREQQKLLAAGRSDEGVGVRYFLALMRAMLRDAPYLMPLGFLHTLVRWLGYRAGAACLHGPERLKRRLSGQEYYWTSKAYRHDREKA